MPSIRAAIFNKLRNFRDLDITHTVKETHSMIEEYSSRISGFEYETVEIALKIPIVLPPGGKNGDCHSVISAVRSKFNELGGGSSSMKGYGSWINKDGIEHSEPHVHICVAIPILSWYTCIPVLRDLILEEIQPKLMQQEVWLTVDGKNIQGGLNLLPRKTVDSFPTIEKFVGIDQDCVGDVETKEPTKFKKFELESIFFAETEEFRDAKSSFLSGDFYSALGKFKQIQYAQNLSMNDHFIAKFNIAILEIIVNKNYKIAKQISEELLLQNSTSAKMYAYLLQAKTDDKNANKSLQKSLSMATSIGNEEGIFQSLKEKIKLENYSELVDYAFKILTGLELTKKPYYHLELRTLEAGRHLVAGEYETASNAFEEIIPSLIERNYKALLSKAMHNRALCFSGLNQFGDAQKLFLNCIELDVKLGLDRSLAITKYNFAVSIMDEDRFINYEDGFLGTKAYAERAIDLLLQGLDHIDGLAPSSLHRAIYAKMYLVSVPLDSLKYEEIAVKGLIDYYVHRGDKPGMLAAKYEDLAAIHEERGDYPTTIATLHQSIGIRRNHNLNDSLWFPVRGLARAYLSIGIDPFNDDVFSKCMDEMPSEDSQSISEFIKKIS